MRTRLLMLVAAVSLASSVASRTGAAAESTAAPAEAASSASESTSKSGALPQVTVMGRLKLESKVAGFVHGITAPENQEGLARWNQPVCPQVSGLPREEGEFILARVSEIARAAGVRLGSEECRANLYIFVTNQPRELLRAMERRNRSVTFNGAAQVVVDEFIDTPRAVRVWYNSYKTAPGGVPLTPRLPADTQFVGNALTATPLLFVSAPEGGSRLTRTVVWAFSYVYVVVDQTQLRSLSRRQLADYVGMISLAQIKRFARPGDTRTILNLFTGAPEDAPAGMSDWDQLFLKSLYATDQQSVTQRSLIARSMVRGIVR